MHIKKETKKEVKIVRGEDNVTRVNIRGTITCRCTEQIPTMRKIHSALDVEPPFPEFQFQTRK